MPPKGSKQSTTAPSLKFTTYSVIGFLNGKNVAANYVKNDSQGWYSRRSSEADWDKEREGKRRRLMASEEELEQLEAGPVPKLNVLKSAPTGMVQPAPEAVLEDDAAEDEETTTDPLSKTIVIHPGSKWLRIGRASDAFPLAVPYIIARKQRNFVPSSRDKGKQREEPHSAPAPAPAPAPPPQSSFASFGQLPPLPGADEDTDMLDDDDDDDRGPAVDPAAPVDPLSAKISSIRGDLRARMRAFKLRGQGNGNSQAMAFNATVTPDATADYNDPGEIEWTKTEGEEAQEVYVGAEALRIPDAEASGYIVRRPYDRGGFNTEGYTSQQELLGDIEKIWLTTLEEELGIRKTELKDYSAILLIPDLYDDVYVREMTDLVLKWIGFKQICLQQESVAATFGAGISTACVIDIGAKLSTVTCIEEGLVLPETRMALDFGGDDITQFLHTLLQRTGLPYRDADLARWYDFTIMEDLKERMVVLSEADVGLNLYDFYVRVPGKPTRKYKMRIYDDVILAPYALFAPRVVDFESKYVEQPELWSKNVEDVVDIGGGATTNAMKNSTRHLLAAPIAAAPSLQLPLATDSLAPSPAGTPNPDDSGAFSTLPLHSASAAPSPSAAPVDTPTAGGADTTGIVTKQATPSKELPPSATKIEIDIRAESSKIPLDVAVVESIVAAGAEDRMKKLASNILIIGGTGLIHNIGFAVESRVSSQLAYRVPSLAGTVSIVPPPREIDPRILAWKGIAVLSKLDCANDLWIRKEDWENLGMRAVRERAFYFS